MRPVVSLAALAGAALGAIFAFAPTSTSASTPGTPSFVSSAPDTHWLPVHASGTEWTSRWPDYDLGGLASGGPSNLQTFDFEGGRHDTAGTVAPWIGNGFSAHDGWDADVAVNPWHVDAYRAFAGASLWCGSRTGLDLDSCSSWANAPGYPGNLRAVVEWNPGAAIDPADSMTLAGRISYDLECGVDFGYVEVSLDAGVTWTTLATVSGTSGAGGGGCGDDFGAGSSPGGPSWIPFSLAFAGAPLANPGDLRVRFLVESNGAGDDDTDVYPFDSEGAMYVDVLDLTDSFSGEATEDFEGPYDADGLPEGWDRSAAPVLLTWEIRADVDPPNENDGVLGVDGCAFNGTWAWNVAPMKRYGAATKWIPTGPGRLNMQLWSPRIPAADPSDPSRRGLVVQWDEYHCLNVLHPLTDDATEIHYRVHSSQMNGGNGGWCGWRDPLDGLYFATEGGCGAWNFDVNLGLSEFVAPATVDSIQLRWNFVTHCTPDLPCWGEHKYDDFVLDDFSVGYFDGSATWIEASTSWLFQDTYDDVTCLHTLNVAQSQEGLPLDDPEDSLSVRVTDSDGVSEVRLYYSTDWGSSFDWIPMTLSEDESPPAGAGIYRGTVCPADLGVSTWHGGRSPFWPREIRYYVRAEDALGNYAYWPRTADPALQKPKHLEVSVLPRRRTPGGLRGLVVAGWDRSHLNYTDTDTATFDATADAYEEAIWAFIPIFSPLTGPFDFDFFVYDVNAAENPDKREPWTLVVNDTLLYDWVIWFTGPLDHNVLRDTTQLVLADYVDRGGKLYMSGHALGRSLETETDPRFAEQQGFSTNYLGTAPIPGQDLLSDGWFKSWLPPRLDGLTGTKTVGEDSTWDVDHWAQRFLLGCPVREYPDSLQLAADSSFATHQTLATYEASGSFNGGLAGVYTEIDRGQGAVGQVVWTSFGIESIRGLSDRSWTLGDVLFEIFGGYPHWTPAPDAPAPPAVFSLSQNHPNPFNPETAISLSLDREGTARLTVFNLLGQRVRSLVDERLPAGARVVHWDGTTDSGRPAPSGVYFYRLESPAGVLTRRMVLTR